jgi:hypothetical protein
MHKPFDVKALIGFFVAVAVAIVSPGLHQSLLDLVETNDSEASISDLHVLQLIDVEACSLNEIRLLGQGPQQIARQV